VGFNQLRAKKPLNPMDPSQLADKQAATKLGDNMPQRVEVSTAWEIEGARNRWVGGSATQVQNWPRRTHLVQVG
jgi:hypothetical protein